MSICAFISLPRSVHWRTTSRPVACCISGPDTGWHQTASAIRARVELVGAHDQAPVSLGHHLLIRLRPLIASAVVDDRVRVEDLGLERRHVRQRAGMERRGLDRTLELVGER